MVAELAVLERREAAVGVVLPPLASLRFAKDSPLSSIAVATPPLLMAAALFGRGQKWERRRWSGTVDAHVGGGGDAIGDVPLAPHALRASPRVGVGAPLFLEKNSRLAQLSTFICN